MAETHGKAEAGDHGRIIIWKMKPYHFIALLLIISMAISICGCSAGIEDVANESKDTLPMVIESSSVATDTIFDITSKASEEVKEEIPANLFGGIGVCSHASLGNDIALTFSAANSVGATWIRDEIRWDHVEKTIGVLEMPSYAQWVDEANKSGINALAILAYGNPIYPAGKLTDAEKADGRFVNCAMPVRDGDPNTTSDDEYFNAFLTYVDFVSKEMKGKIAAYEIWNEPDIKAFNAKDATPADYAELLKHSYEIIKKNDPDAIVVGCVLANDTEYLKGILSNGAAEYMDALSFHFYLGKSSPENGARNMMNRIKRVVNEFGINDMPLWLTETGWATSNVDENTQAQYTLKNAVIYEDFLMDNSISGQYFVYELHDSNTSGNNLGGADYESSLGLVKYDYSPKSATQTVAAYNKIIAGKSLVQQSDKIYGLSQSAYSAEFEGSDGSTAYILWATGKDMIFTVSGESFTIYDFMGNIITSIEGGIFELTLTKSPIFIECSNTVLIEYGVKK